MGAMPTLIDYPWACGAIAGIISGEHARFSGSVLLQRFVVPKPRINDGHRDAFASDALLMEGVYLGDGVVVKIVVIILIASYQGGSAIVLEVQLESEISLSRRLFTTLGSWGLKADFQVCSST
jgi:hypothetical protein